MLQAQWEQKGERSQVQGGDVEGQGNVPEECRPRLSSADKTQKD